MKKTGFVLLVVLLVPVLCFPQTAKNDSIIIRAVEFFGIEGGKEKELYNLVGIEEGKKADRKHVNKRLKTAKPEIESLPDVLMVNVDRISFRSHIGELKSGMYITFDIVTDINPAYKSLRPAPEGKIRLKKNILDLLNKYNEAAEQAEEKDIYEEDKNGFYYYEDSSVKKIISEMSDMADSEFDHLVNVLFNSSDVSHRMSAATFIGAAKDKNKVTDVLLKAIKDNYSGVRNNAARVMIPITKYGIKSGKYKVPAEPFIEMLHLPTVTDRNKAAAVIAHSLKNNKKLGEIVKEKVGPLLVKMAESKQPNNFMYARPIIKNISGRDYSKSPDGWKEWLSDLEK